MHKKTASMVVMTAPSADLAEEISLLFGSTVLLEAAQLVWPSITSIRIKPLKIKTQPRSKQLSMELAA